MEHGNTESMNRIICIPEDFTDRMRDMAARENLNANLAELIAQKMMDMSIPEDRYLQDKARSYQAGA